jgi:signal transduction histidine kinase
VQRRNIVHDFRSPADKQSVAVDASDFTELDLRMARELARQLRVRWLMYSLFCVMMSFQPELGGRRPIGFWGLTVLVSALGAYRGWRSRAVLEGKGGSAAVRPLLRAVALHSIAWGAFIGFAFRAAWGNVPLECATVIGVAGFTSAGAGALSPFPRLAFVHLGFQGCAALVWAACAHERFGWLIAVLVVCFLVFVGVNMIEQHRHTLGMVKSQFLLEIRGEELTRAKERAEEASSARASFLANMSHEIRTPLHGVLGLAQLLGETPLAPEQASLLDSLRRSGDHLLALVNDVLDFSRIGAGKLAIESVPFEMAALLRDVAVPSAAAARAKGLTWELACPPEASGWRRGDPLRIRQVLGNLLNNAVKFTEEGGVRMRVMEPRPGSIRFTVIDSGIGMTAGGVERLFRDFSQVDASTTRRFGGSGLGLAISKHLAELMGGTLAVESESGVGSRFAFELPLQKVEAAAAAAPSFSAGEGAGFRLSSSCRILVAEDNPINRTIAERFLRGIGASVETAENGKLAVAQHAANPYDLILMDCHMPEMDGFEATAAIRAQAIRPNVPILAVTASALSVDRERCLLAGMDYHISKPLRRKELVEAISCALERPGAAPFPGTPAAPTARE